MADPRPLTRANFKEAVSLRSAKGQEYEAEVLAANAPGKKAWVINQHFDANGAPTHVSVYAVGKEEYITEVAWHNVKSVEAHWTVAPYCNIPTPIATTAPTPAARPVGRPPSAKAAASV
jgi:hypothetical protein